MRWPRRPDSLPANGGGIPREVGQVAPGVGDVAVRNGAYPRYLRIGQRADHLARRAHDQRAVRDDLAFGYQRAGAAEALLPQDGRVQNHGLDADERPFADRAAVQHYLM